MKNLFKETLRFMTLRARLDDELLNYELSKQEKLTKYGIQKDTTSVPNGQKCPKRNVPNGQEEDKDYER